MAIKNVSVQYNGGFLPDNILLTLCDDHRGTRLNPVEFLYLQLGFSHVPLPPNQMLNVSCSTFFINTHGLICCRLSSAAALLTDFGIDNMASAPLVDFQTLKQHFVTVERTYHRSSNQRTNIWFRRIFHIPPERLHRPGQVLKNVSL